MTARKRPRSLDETAQNLAQDLTRLIQENDPAKEAAFLASEQARDAEVSRALKAHLAKKHAAKTKG